MGTTLAWGASPLLDLLFEDPLVGRCLVAPEGSVLRANREWLRSTGFALDDVLGVNIIDLFPETRDMALALHARARSGHRVEVPRHAQTVNGRDTWWVGSIDPVPMERGTGLLITARELTGERTHDAAGTTQEVTDRTRMQDALRESEDRLRLLFQNMLEGFAYCRMVFDVQGQPVDFVYLDVNAAFEKLTGLRDVVGKKVSEVIPGIRQSEADLLATYGRVARTGQPERFEIHFRPLSTWLAISVYSPRPDHFVAVFDNITARKRTEEALQGERRLLESVTKATDVMLVYLDPDFNFVWVNEAYAVTCRKRPEEMIGKNHFALYPHEENEAIFRRVRDSGEAVFYKDKPFEFPDQPERGVTYWDWSLVPAKRAGGEVIGLVLSLRETTKYKRADERLAADLAALTRMHDLSGRVVESASIAPLLQETMDAAVAIVAADKGTLHLLEGDTLRIVAHCGHEAPFLDFFATAENVACVCGEATRRGERVLVPDVETSPIFAATASLPILRAAGVRAVQSTPLRTRSGRLLGILTTHWSEPHTPDEHDLWRLDLLARQAADFIDQKQAEEAVRQAARALEAVNAELREANHRKDEFLGMLSHELRNPLAPIRNAAYILEHAGPGSDQARRARAVIQRQAEHLTRLVDDLLDVTRIARGKIELRLSRVDLREVISRAAEDFRVMMHDRGVRLDVLLPDGSLSADADATRVTQVIGNLLHNASKFTRRGDSVTLSIGVGEGWAEIRVRDTGAGIDAKLLPTIFEPFVQGERTLARTEGGLGLGLALVKGIVELHGGSVRADSAGNGKGSEFVVRLPVVPSTTRDEPPELTERRQRGLRVLVVDDNPDAAESLADLVAMLGHTVEVAYDGPTAIAKARATPPNVVLCDIGLPGMTGYEVAKALRIGNRDGMLIFAVSGYARSEDVQRAIDAGFDGHVAKPCDPQTIERLLS